MMKKVTLWADAGLIMRAQKMARLQGKSLSGAFREWLDEYVVPAGNPREFDELMQRLGHIRVLRRFPGTK
jgi:hypothetical protein